VAKVFSYNILKTLAVYGVNSRGKPNLVNALHKMAACVPLILETKGSRIYVAVIDGIYVRQIQTVKCKYLLM